jgi:hypothetical protein
MILKSFYKKRIMIKIINMENPSQLLNNKEYRK